MTSNPTADRLALALDSAGLTALRIIFVESSNEQLLELWDRNSGKPGDPIADILAVELARREVEF
jgi:hypothetical protein